MSKDIKSSLEQINEVSRQLLSRILTTHNKNQEDTANVNESNIDESVINSSVAASELIELVSTRHHLIHCLFEQNAHEEISTELNLLNEMLSLDNELSSQSKSCKNALAEQVIRLKKSKKVTKSYQQY